MANTVPGLTETPKDPETTPTPPFSSTDLPIVSTTVMIPIFSAGAVTSPIKVNNSEVTMVTIEADIAETILGDPITIDSYLNGDILRDNFPFDKPHVVNILVDFFSFF